MRCIRPVLPLTSFYVSGEAKLLKECGGGGAGVSNKSPAFLFCLLGCLFIFVL